MTLGKAAAHGRALLANIRSVNWPELHDGYESSPAVRRDETATLEAIIEIARRRRWRV